MKKPLRRPALLLTELILDLFIFIVCTVVCTGLLFRASAMSRDAEELTQAICIAQTAAEKLYIGASVASLDDLGADTGYDVQILARNGTDGYQIIVSRDDREIYTLETGG